MSTRRAGSFPSAAPSGRAVSQPPSFFQTAGAAGVGAGMVAALRQGERSDLPGRVQSLTRRNLQKELHLLRLIALRLQEPARSGAISALAALSLPADAFAAFLDAEPPGRLAAHSDALRAALPAWQAPQSRIVRTRELERLAALTLDGEPPERLAPIFAAPDRPTDPKLRGLDARGLYDLYVAAVRGAEPGEPPQTLEAPGKAPASGLLTTVKQVEQWILDAADWRETMSAATEQAFRRLRIKRFVAEYDFDALRLAALEASFGAWEPLRALAKAPVSFAQMRRRYEDGAVPLDPAAALALVADALADDVDAWIDPARFLRMSRAEAGRAVERLDDLQYVLESILDDRWAGQGPAWAGPRARLPAALVDPLGAEWAAANGLRREGSDYVIARDAS